MMQEGEPSSISSEPDIAYRAVDSSTNSISSFVTPSSENRRALSKCRCQITWSFPGLRQSTCVTQELLKNLEEGLVVDKLWALILVNLREVMEHLGLDILDQVRVGPEPVEPRFQLIPVGGVAGDEVEFNVAAGVLQAESAGCKVGAAQDGDVLAVVCDVVELAVKEIRLADRFDVHLPANPVSAFPGNALLLECIGQL